jgi:hypothetical protein
MAYLKTVKGVDIKRAEKTMRGSGTEIKSMVIELARNQDALSVPELELVDMRSATPPQRTLRVKP